MNRQITMDWDGLATRGGIKAGKKGGPFISRMTGRTAEGTRHSTAGKVRGLQFSEPCKLAKTVEIPINKASDGSFYFQARKAGKFGKRMEISESLARKLEM